MTGRRFTYRQAARRVGRTTATVKRWRRDGMRMGWDVQGGQLVRVVDEEVLLTWLRGRLLADPTRRRPDR